MGRTARTAASMGVSRLTRLAFLGALGLAIYALEYSLPLSHAVPGAKPGLANLATMLALVLCGPGDALFLAAVRPTLSHVLAGSLFSVNHALSLSGSIAAALVMLAVGRGDASRGRLLRTGVAGGIAHSLARVLMAAWLMGQPPAGAQYVYPMALGLVVGAAAGGVMAGFCRRVVETQVGG